MLQGCLSTVARAEARKALLRGRSQQWRTRLGPPSVGGTPRRGEAHRGARRPELCETPSFNLSTRQCKLSDFIKIRRPSASLDSATRPTPRHTGCGGLPLSALASPQPILSSHYIQSPRETLPKPPKPPWRQRVLEIATELIHRIERFHASQGTLPPQFLESEIRTTALS